MNDIFSFRRFGKYLASDARICAANYGLSMLLISFMGVIIYAGTVIMGLIFSGQWGGPEIGFRVTAFAVSAICLAVTMPVKCYGSITEKRYGTQWIMIPVSSFEKFLSMIVMTVFVIPVISLVIYLGLDALLCALDPTCGASILGSVSSLLGEFMEVSIASEGDISTFPDLAAFISQVTNPLLYADDVIGILLIFLAGAVWFKTGKTVKTLLAYAAFSMVIGTAVASFLSIFSGEFSALFLESDSVDAVNQFFGSGMFKNAALIDTINDTLVNIALMALIYFRVKTLKH